MFKNIISILRHPIQSARIAPGIFYDCTLEEFRKDFPQAKTIREAIKLTYKEALQEDEVGGWDMDDNIPKMKDCFAQEDGAWYNASIVWEDVS